jgi:hypothetical protein
MPTLQNYITETQRLLHDGSAQYWTIPELTDYINEGRLEVVCDTGCNRLLQTIFLSTGIEQYTYGATGGGITGAVITAGGSGYVNPVATFSGGGGSGATATVTASNGVVTSITVTNVGSGYTSVPTITITDQEIIDWENNSNQFVEFVNNENQDVNFFTAGPGKGATALVSIINAQTLDILNISVIWGTQRIVLDYMSWTEFNARMRVWQQILSRPAVWSSYGQSSFYLGPIPDQYYSAELDSIVFPAPLVNLTDVDILNPPYSFPVSYYAAYKAKIKEQSYGEAQNFKERYLDRVKDALRSSFTRRIPNSY